MGIDTLDPQLGDAVKFKNLVAAPGLNGEIGHLTKYLEGEKRWAVRIRGGRHVKARLCNLELLRLVDTKLSGSSDTTMKRYTSHTTSSMMESDDYDGNFDGNQGLLDITKTLSQMGLYDDATCAHRDRAIACYLSSSDCKGAVSLFVDACCDKDKDNVEENESV